MKQVLIVSSGLFHPPLLGRRYLRQALSEPGGFTFRTAPSLERLPEDPGPYAALVLYFHQRRVSDRALQALDAFVHSGGGLLALHSATASFKNSQLYFEILGGRFSGHGAVEPFDLRPVPASSIFAGIPAFRVRDELYLYEFQPGIEVHFSTCSQDREVPVIWTRMHGRGRVCCAVPGHLAATLRDPVYRRILQRGLAWAARS